VDRHRFDADLDPDRNFHVDADPYADADPDWHWHQNNADLRADPTVLKVLRLLENLHFLYFESQHCHLTMFYLSYQCQMSYGMFSVFWYIFKFSGKKSSVLY
jgi:hypothetical protein